ncbi:hypothetical protein UlMin_019082 [Ulmus minor]
MEMERKTRLEWKQWKSQQQQQQEPNKIPRLSNDPIIFTEEEASGLWHPHKDAIVVSLRIAGRKVYKILIDNGSSADILFRSTLNRMNLVGAKFEPIKSALYGFTGYSVSSEGVLNLPMELGTHPCQHIQSVNFVVVDCPSSYNAIIGRPTLNAIRAVTSTYHLLVKFPTVGGIGVLKGDQQESRDIYEAANRPSNVHRVNIIETPGGSSLTGQLRTDLINFLRDHRDVFAWSHEDMPGIDPKVIIHRLNIDPSFRPVKQKRRTFNAERYMAINTEVDKLIKADFIREANYPEWIANVVLVKKANGNWRVCVDFTDLNKACPKDSFPLPRIDQLVDATAGHELLSFMDAYSGYNQIRMHQPDQEHTAFLTDQGLYCYKVMPFGLKNT